MNSEKKNNARILAWGLYSSPKKYKFVLGNKDKYLTITEGEKFQFVEGGEYWTPITTVRKSGVGTALICRNYGKDGSFTHEITLLHKRLLLLPLTVKEEKKKPLYWFKRNLKIDKIKYLKKIDLKLALNPTIFKGNKVIQEEYECITDGSIDTSKVDIVHVFDDATYVICCLLENSKISKIKKLYLTPNANLDKLVKLINSIIPS